MPIEQGKFAIESITKESLKGKPFAELEELHAILNLNRQILMDKLAIVHDAKEEAEQLENDKKETDKWSPEKKARMAQVLGGDHIAKDEVTAPGETK